MAIKRTSKSLGTPVRKSATSASLRHVDVRAPHQMVAGEVYPGWVCKNKSCGLVLAIAPAPAGSKPASTDFDDQLAVIKCPHCGNEDLYRWGYRGEHQYTAKGAGA
jgi:rubredoxin